MSTERHRLTIDRVPEAIAGLEFALKEFESEGVRPPDCGRLRQHLRILRQLDGQHAYPSDPQVRAQIATALGDASQFSSIASVLPTNAVNTFLTDVKHSLDGSQVRAAGENPQPYQFQSQLYFGAMLAASGHPIAVKEGDGLPDFFAPDGTLLHPIEVKRPASSAKIRRHLAEAADQIAIAGGRGLLVVDLSDVLQSDLKEVVERSGDADQWRIRFREPFQAQKLAIARLIHRGLTSSAPTARFRSIVAYCVFASGWLWTTSPNVPEGWPEYRAFFYCRRVYSTPGSLTFHRGTRLRDMVERALLRSVGDLKIEAVD